jgi:dTDP-4-dehydrorhamnose reductase
MKILVFGKTGQVAIELARHEPNAFFLSREQADLTDDAACAATIFAHAPEAVINLAAYTAVDKAEHEEQVALQVNAYAPATMARACALLGIPFCHVSTDYVFDGSGTQARTPDAPTGPLSAYGRTKLAGEQAIRAAGGPHVILRTSWVFSAHGKNFVKTMLRVAKERDRLEIVADQTGGPTPAAAIASALGTIARQLRVDPSKSGTYHFAGTPDVSWADFAREIFVRAGCAVRVMDIATVSYPTPARRPANSRLDCTSTTRAFGIHRPDWRKGLGNVLNELGRLS